VLGLGTSNPTVVFETVGTSNIGSLLYVNTGTGFVGVGTSSPTTVLSVKGSASFGAGTALLPSITKFGDLDTGAWFPAADTFAVSTGGSERLRVTSAGQVLVGSSVLNAAEIAGSGSAGGSPMFQLESNPSSVLPMLSVVSYSTTAAYGSTIYLARSHSGTVGTNTLVLNGDVLGGIRFAGADGTDLRSAGAEIFAAVDGAPGTNDMPGRLVFSTTADGASSPTERMRITSMGNVGIGTTAPTTLLTVNGVASFGAGTALLPSITKFGDLNTGAWFPAADTLAVSTKGLERIRINSAGNVGIGTPAPSASAILDVQSTTKGLRLPNMTAAQMYAIVSPAAGLMIWNTSSVNVSVYTGAAWANVKDL
jgi:hypothetical protein